MRYMILIYAEEAGWSRLTPEQQAAGMAAYNAYGDKLRQAGAFVESSRLAPVAKSRQISFAGDKPRVVDGPYADTKEQLGGFYYIEAKNDEEAIRWASECPGARFGRVELRPVF